MLDRMKDYKHCLFKWQNRNLNGRVHNLKDPLAESDFEQDAYNYELADQVIDTCLVELNMLEFPPQTSSWYLNSGATHHVYEDPSVFTTIHPASGARVRSAGGQNHEVTRVGHVNILVSFGLIKIVSSVLVTPVSGREGSALEKHWASGCN